MKTIINNTGRTNLWKRALTIFLLFTVLILPIGPLSNVYADEGESPNQATNAGLGIASVLLTIPYGVLKIVYAGLGGIVGGFTWALTGGNTEAAQSVWEPSFYGTYVITPAHLKGEEPVRFFGASPYENEYIDD